MLVYSRQEAGIARPKQAARLFERELARNLRTVDSAGSRSVNQTCGLSNACSQWPKSSRSTVSWQQLQAGRAGEFAQCREPARSRAGPSTRLQRANRVSKSREEAFLQESLRRALNLHVQSYRMSRGYKLGNHRGRESRRRPLKAAMKTIALAGAMGRLQAAGTGAHDRAAGAADPLSGHGAKPNWKRSPLPADSARKKLGPRDLPHATGQGSLRQRGDVRRRALRRRGWRAAQRPAHAIPVLRSMVEVTYLYALPAGRCRDRRARCFPIVELPRTSALADLPQDCRRRSFSATLPTSMHVCVFELPHPAFLPYLEKSPRLRHSNRVSSSSTIGIRAWAPSWYQPESTHGPLRRARPTARWARPRRSSIAWPSEPECCTPEYLPNAADECRVRHAYQEAPLAAG